MGGKKAFINPVGVRVYYDVNTNGPNWTIRKYNGNVISSSLIYWPTENLYCLMANNKVIEFSQENIKTFLSDIPGNNPIVIKSDKVFYNIFSSESDTRILYYILTDATIMNLSLKGVFVNDDLKGFKGSQKDYDEIIYRRANWFKQVYPQFYREMDMEAVDEKHKANRFIATMPDVCRGIIGKWGSNKLISFLEYFERSSYEFRYCERPEEEREAANKATYVISEDIEYQDWKDYVLNKGFSMGYSGHWYDVFRDFADVCELQEKLCGKIVNPYPENLSSDKSLLEYLNRILEEEGDEYDISPALKNFRMWDKNGYSYYVPGKLSTVLISAYKMKSSAFLNYRKQMSGEEILVLMYKENDFSKPVAAIVIDSEFSHIIKMVQDYDKEANPVKTAQIKMWFDEHKKQLQKNLKRSCSTQGNL